MSHNYDKNTGQIFNERVVHPTKPDKVEWYRNADINVAEIDDPLPQLFQGVIGVYGLVDIAVRVVVKNFNSLEVGDLDHVPSHLVHRIYSDMKWRSERLSLQSLKMFLRHLDVRPLPLRLHRRNYEILQTDGPLSKYIIPLKSPSFEFIVHLTLCGPQSTISTHQLLALTDLKNLGVLEILQPPEENNFPKIFDAIIRQWSQESDPFPVLRVMRIWGDHFTTVNSLQYLSKFPALAIYDVAGLERDWGLNTPEDPAWASKSQTWEGRNLCSILHYPLSLLRPHSVYETRSYNHKGSFDGHWKALTEALRGRPEIKNTIEDREKAKHELMTETAIRPIEIPTEYWGYLLYRHIGQLWEDKDLIAQGLPDAQQAHVLETGYLIPPRPYVTLKLGKCCDKPKRKTYKHKIFSNYAQSSVLEYCCRGPGTMRSFEAHRVFARADYPGDFHKALDSQTSSSGSDSSSTNTGSSTGSKRSSDQDPTPKMRKKPKAFPSGEFANFGMGGS